MREGVGPHVGTTVSQSLSGTVVPGTEITIVVRETNTGDDTLTNVFVDGTGCIIWTPASVASLAPGAFADFTCKFSPTADTNWTATGHGTDSSGAPVPAAGEFTSGNVDTITPATTLTFVSQTPANPVLAGTFYWQATYSGDPPDTPGPVSSVCTSETLVVGPNTPAPHSTPVVQIKDTLTVSGFTANVTGNVLVGLYSDATCTTQIGSNTSFAASLFVGGGSQETSFVTVTSGSYFFKISYAGDGNNTSFSSCAERVDVTITSLP